MALTVSARSSFSGPSTASLIKGAAICAAVGIGSSLTEYADYGKWLAVAGVLLRLFSNLPRRAGRRERSGSRQRARARASPERAKAKAKAKAKARDAHPAVEVKREDARRRRRAAGDSRLRTLGRSVSLCRSAISLADRDLAIQDFALVLLSFIPGHAAGLLPARPARRRAARSAHRERETARPARGVRRCARTRQSRREDPCRVMGFVIRNPGAVFRAAGARLRLWAPAWRGFRSRCAARQPRRLCLGPE